MASIVWLLIFLGGAFFFAYRRASLATATLAYGVAIFAYSTIGDGAFWWLSFLWLVLAGLVLLNIDSIRMRYITRPFLRIYRR